MQWLFVLCMHFIRLPFRDDVFQYSVSELLRLVPAYRSKRTSFYNWLVTLSICTVNALLSPRGTYLILGLKKEDLLARGLNRDGGLFQIINFRENSH